MAKTSYLQRLAARKQSAAFDTFLGNYRQLNGCPVTATLQVLGGKWKPVLLYCISHDVNRFGELLNLLEGISKKVLTEQLRELERDGILTRTVYEQLPARVDYRLTKNGQTLLPLVEVMCRWGLEQFPRLAPALAI
jgi:DNA-binding HxlR family transcriptional regulator